MKIMDFQWTGFYIIGTSVIKELRFLAELNFTKVNSCKTNFTKKKAFFLHALSYSRALIMTWFRVKHDQYFLSFSYFVEFFNEPLGE